MGEVSLKNAIRVKRSSGSRKQGLSWGQAGLKQSSAKQSGKILKGKGILWRQLWAQADARPIAAGKNTDWAKSRDAPNSGNTSEEKKVWTEGRLSQFNPCKKNC